MFNKLGAKFTDLFQKIMPSAFVFALLLTIGISLTAFFWAGASPLKIVESWYDGFWLLLEFGMQVVLLIITGYSIALSPLARKGINTLGNFIKTPNQVYYFVVLIGSLLCMISWGWTIITAVLAREMALRVKGVNYPFLIACVYFSGGSWVFGLSSSIPLLLNTPDNYMIEAGVLSDTISTSATLGASLNIAMLLLFVILTPIMMRLLAPKEQSIRTLDDMLVKKDKSNDITIRQEASQLKLPYKALSDQLNNSVILQLIVALMGLSYIIFHFATKGLELNLNIMIFTFLILGLFLHQTPIRFSVSMERASSNVSGILFQYPFYAGIMGIMLYTGLGDRIADVMASAATLETFPFYAFISGGLVNFAIPSAGGEFAVMGPSIIAAVNELAAGLPPEEITAIQSRAALSLAYGESLTNALQPFFLLLILPIMGAGIKIQARDVMGYLVIPFIVYFIIESMMVVWWPL